MGDVVMALGMQALLTLALLRGPWIRLHPALATGVVVMGGALLGAIAFRVSHYTGMPPFWSVGLLVIVAGSLSVLAQRHFPASESGFPPEAGMSGVGPVPLWERLACYGMWAAFAFILFVYLWANGVQPPSLYQAAFPWGEDVHPPNLYSALFEWSDPARTGDQVRGFALSLSAFYLQFADSDLGWKFLWSVLGLFPWLALFGGLRELGVRPAAAVLAVAGPAGSVAALFWGSTGHPDLFLSGCVLMLFFLAATPRPLGRWLLPLGLLILFWSGPLWAALGTLMGLAGTAMRPGSSAQRGLWAGAAVIVLAYWGWVTSFGGELFGATAAYLAWDAFHIARYGVMAYLILAVAVRYGNREHLQALAAGVALPLLVVMLESTSREGMEIIRIDGTRLLTVALLLGWGVALTILSAVRVAPSEEQRDPGTSTRNDLEIGRSV